MAKVKSGIEMAERMASLEAKVDGWIENTALYRREKDNMTKQQLDIQRIQTEKIDQLHLLMGSHTSLTAQIKAVWLLIIAQVGFFVTHLTGHK